MQPHTIVSREEWIAARKAHLAHEKEYTSARERLAEERRALPWVKVDKDYMFDGPDGKVSLGDLFKGRSQLVVQHVMFAPDWNEACKSCSFWADGFERMIPHLAARDTTMVAISRAPLPKLTAFRQRMGWTFDWLSSGGNDFNYDYGVSFMPEQIKRRQLQFRNHAVRKRGSARNQRVLSRRGREHLPHLFLLRARPRHDERCLSLPRPDPARAS